jgi:hypothetical protein
MNPDPTIAFKLPLVEVSGTGTLAVILASVVVVVFMLALFCLIDRRATFLAKLGRSALLAVRHIKMTRNLRHVAGPSIVPVSDHSSAPKEIGEKHAA